HLGNRTIRTIPAIDATVSAFFFNGEVCPACPMTIKKQTIQTAIAIPAMMASSVCISQALFGATAGPAASREPTAPLSQGRGRRSGRVRSLNQPSAGFGEFRAPRRSQPGSSRRLGRAFADPLRACLAGSPPWDSTLFHTQYNHKNFQAL